MIALKRIPWRKRRAKAQEWARKSHESRRRNMAERGVDAETARKLALEEGRGMVLRHGLIYSAAHPDGRTWEIICSKEGRTNQVDLRVNNAVKDTCGMRELERRLSRPRH